MKKSAGERRSEPRHTAEGEVRLRRSGAMGAPFLGRLVDLSPHGFRTRHSCLTLGSGDRVDFEFQGRHGAARAMWTRIVDSEAETGFNILGEAD
jgi:hypothetical protein